MSYMFNLISWSLLIIPIVVVTFFFGKSKCNLKKKLGLALCDVLALAGTIFTLRTFYMGRVPLMILLCVSVPLMIVYGLTIYILIENNNSAQSTKSSNYGSNYTQQ